MKIKSIVAGVAMASVFSTAALAEGAAGSGPNPYSDCGIGAALFPNHNVGAVISNVIWDIGTTAVTSATASPETCQGSDAQAAAFIFETYDQLLEETAKGRGEHIASLMNILEVPEAKQQDLVADIRLSLAKDLASSDFEHLNKVEKAEAFYRSVVQAIAT